MPAELPPSVLDHASDPQNRGTMQEPTAVGRANLGGRPPEVILFLKVSADVIERAMFEAHGCGYTIACCSVLTELVSGMKVADCQALSREQIIAELGELPPQRQFCATLAVEALQAALQQLPSVPGSASLPPPHRSDSP